MESNDKDDDLGETSSSTTEEHQPCCSRSLGSRSSPDHQMVADIQTTSSGAAQNLQYTASNDKDPESSHDEDPTVKHSPSKLNYYSIKKNVAREPAPFFY